MTGVKIEREILIGASMRHVLAVSETCPCPSALTVLPEGAGTRLRAHAEVSPDDLAEFVESQLVAMLRSIRSRVDARAVDVPTPRTRATPPDPPTTHSPTNKEPDK